MQSYAYYFIPLPQLDNTYFLYIGTVLCQNSKQVNDFYSFADYNNLEFTAVAKQRATNSNKTSGNKKQQ